MAGLRGTLPREVKTHPCGYHFGGGRSALHTPFGGPQPPPPHLLCGCPASSVLMEMFPALAFLLHVAFSRLPQSCPTGLQGLLFQVPIFVFILLWLQNRIVWSGLLQPDFFRSSVTSVHHFAQHSFVRKHVTH